MISRAVSAPSAHHPDPDVDRPSGYAYGCAQITRSGTASGDRHSDLVADHNLSWAKLVRKSTGISARCGISGLQADPAVQVLVLRGGATGETGKSFEDADHLLGGGAAEFFRLRPFRSGSRELAAVGQR